MSNVVAFPSPMSNQRTPDEGHAMSDARAYAKRHGIPVTWRDRPLAVGLDEPTPHRPGEISIWPDPEDGGCWRVDHTSASGDSGTIVGSAFSLDEAMRIARDAAVRFGATFDEPSPHFGGAA